MTKNSLYDLNDHLFAQMERLSEEGLDHDRLLHEVCRTEAITKVSKEIITNAQLLLDAQIKISDLPARVTAPAMLKQRKE